MEAFNPPQRSHNAQSLRSNLFQPTSPPRVSTDPDSSSKRIHLHGPHHPHRHHHHSRRAKDTVQSAIQLHPPTSFGDLLKQSSRSSHQTPAPSAPESRCGSVKPELDDIFNVPPLKPVRPEDVAKERKKVKAREAELRSSLQTLSEHSLKTSRRLDDTYYSILEKVSVLRQMIGSLQELSGLTKELHENFQSDTQELAEEVKGQVEAFDNFESQQEQVERLEERIKAGREKADALNARLEEARKRVQDRAKIEADWEAKTTRKILWGILGTIAGLIVVAILFQQFKSIHSAHDPEHPLKFGPRSILSDDSIPEPAKEVLLQHSATRQGPQTLSKPATSASAIENDSRLRIFDEL
ncbi:hypothetical protein K469DRAFT_568939 [Zopfia rhizophila CBS 207.26]|uniref:Uncharacterized protein n=1 Tax=Zopfia rhizophila CBS 207.26 TaxID=1314779 RepID=A0A6A6E751_9PEZI|nr:hypothetical protein K469DRAFT_568939 [Zopfia rhizophila CBS 207.26]